MIRVENLTKIYKPGKPDAVTALADVSFQINQGEVVLLQGPSGSGKSSILSLIAALSRPTHGAVYLDEICVSKLPDHFASQLRREKFGIIFQEFNLIPGLSVKDNIGVPLIPRRMASQDYRERLDELMQQFSLTPLQDKHVRLLSGGEKQRVAIARSLANQPDIILADEPTANLDTALTAQFLEYVAAVNRQGKTLIIATHDARFENLTVDFRVFSVENGSVLCS